MNWMTEIDLLVTENKFSKPEKSKLPWWKRIETIYNCEPEQTKRGERKEKKSKLRSTDLENKENTCIRAEIEI
ncbi:MAG: hypothetical protein PHT89_02910 [Lachnospiraceae bacterium]|nr:hypothetical protein [Lachnospiraceae bacterium]MDD3659651.1 hypothetical protein [Lachnospiraceae bacterium]